MDDIAWEDWDAVALPWYSVEDGTRFELNVTGKSRTLNNSGPVANCGIATPSERGFLLLFLPLRDKNRPIRTLCLSINGGMGFADGVFDDIGALTISFLPNNYSKLRAGKTISFYGLRLT